MKNVEITFKDDLVVLIGENDGGKTSIVDTLKIMFNNKTVEEDDFYYGTNKICITVETDDKTFIKEFEKNNGGITSRTGILFSKSELEEICDYLNSDEFNSLPTDDDKKNKLKEYFGLFNITPFRRNSRVDTLKQKVLEKLEYKVGLMTRDLGLASGVYTKSTQGVIIGSVMAFVLIIIPVILKMLIG